MNDPRAKNPYSKLYTVEYLNNMTGGRPVLYVNQPIGVLKDLTMKSIADGEVIGESVTLNKELYHGSARSIFSILSF